MPAQQAAVATWDLPRRFVVHNRHEHVQAAAVRVAATKGYQAMTARDICEAAHISLDCFHEHFADKEQAVLSGIEAGVDQVMAFCQEVYRSSQSWPDAVWDALQGFAEWARAEPEFVRTGIVELLAIGPAALDLLQSLLDAFGIFLAPGYDFLDSPTRGSLDTAISQRVYELLYEHLTHHPAETAAELVPDIARTGLLPFLGPQATEAFIARRQNGRPTRRGTS